MPRIVLGDPVLAIIGIPKWLTDPLDYIRDKLVDLYNSLSLYVQDWIVNPPHPAPGEWLDYLYGNAFGLSIYLIASVAVLTIFLMVISPRQAHRFLKGGIVAAVIGMAYPLWFSAGNWFSDAGSEMIKAVAFNPGGSSELLFLPEIDNVLGAIFGLLALLLLGGLLLVIFFAYEILLVVATVLGLPLLALSPLGEGFKRKFEQMVVLVVVTSFFGRLAAVGILSLGTQIIQNFAVAGTTFGSVLTLIATLALACYAQYYLIKKADKIYGDITGRTLGTSRVTGMVETIRKPARRETDMAGIQAAHVSALSPALVTNPPRLRLGTSVSNTTTTPTLAPSVAPRRRTFRRGGSG